MAWERGCKLQGNLVCSHLVCIYLPLALVSFSAINYITYYIISLITDKVFKNNAFRKPRGKCKNEVRLLDHLKLKFGHRWQSKLITIKLNSNKNGKTGDLPGDFPKVSGTAFGELPSVHAKSLRNILKR